MKQTCGRILLSLALFATSLPALAQSKEQTALPDRPAEKKIFSFDGGTMRDFVFVVKDQLGFDLDKAATIHENARNLPIPKMKIPTEQGWQGVLEGYNLLSQRTEKSLGRWVMASGPGHVGQTLAIVEAIVFIPPATLAEAATINVKAFSVREFEAEERQMLIDLIETAAMGLRHKTGKEGGGNFDGQTRFHEGTNLVIASGGKEYVALAATVIEAHKGGVETHKAEVERRRRL